MGDNKKSPFDDLWQEILRSYSLASKKPAEESAAAVADKKESIPAVIPATTSATNVISTTTDTTTSSLTSTIKTPAAATIMKPPTQSRGGGREKGHHPHNRLIRSFTLFDNRDFLPRTFQIELYEACKSRDTIVFLRPGNGKHFITVMLVKYFAPKSGFGAGESLDVGQLSSSARKMFFLAKSSNSIRLYASVFRAHTDFRVAEYCPEDPDEVLTNALPWKSEEDWSKQFASADIHLMLDTLFMRLLKAGYVSADNIQLLILDDVHKIILEDNSFDDPYSVIVRRLGSQGLKKNCPAYRILGLTASILVENVSSRVFASMIDKIERALDCTCETYADLRMINKYSIQCRIKVRYYPAMAMGRFEELMVDEHRLRLSLFKIRNYASQYYEFLINFTEPKLQDQINLVTHEMLSLAITEVLHALSTMGEWCALKLVDLFNREIVDTITLLKSNKSNYLKLLASTSTTLELVKKSILDYLPTTIADRLIKPNSGKLTLAEFLSLSSPKLHLLASLMHNYLAELRSSSSPIQSTFSFPANICSLIYAERRSTVRILAAWISELVALTADMNQSHGFTYLLPDYVFLRDEDRISSTGGTSSIYYQKQQQRAKSLHEIFYYRRQEEVLKRFRFAHNCNLLVTSSMSAEGLDVNRCNLVVCFDPPKSFQQFIQSKGRVRAENGLFYVLVEDTPELEHEYVKGKFRQFCEIEKIFTKLVPLANEISIEARSSTRSSKFDMNLISTVGSSTDSKTTAAATDATTGATLIQLTLENAISILNRYCLKLPSDTFTKLAPHYYIDGVTIPSIDGHANPAQKYQCRLYLPINSTFRDEIRGDPASNRMLAKRSAAFKAVKKLQEIGELDVNYYPVGKETNRYIEKLGLQECFITTQRVMATDGSGVTTVQLQQQTPPVLHQQPQRSGNRYNRLQARNIASKRRQYYYKKVADYLVTGECFVPVARFIPAGQPKIYQIEHLYEFEMQLTCPLAEEQNTRGRPLVDPADTSRTFGIVTPNSLPPLCDFTIYNRSGEVTVRVRRLKGARDSGVTEKDVIVDEERVGKLRRFHQFTIENVLRLGKNSLRSEFSPRASNGNFVIVPINDVDHQSQKVRTIDWDFVDSIIEHQNELQALAKEKESPPSPPPMSGPITPKGKFEFKPELYSDAVVIPKYRRDKMQAFFYVAEICKDLTPLSPFPDHGFQTFEEYYRLKYNLVITNLAQPLLDVDHTSSRLNLLTPRYLNRQGVDPNAVGPTAAGKSKKKKPHNLQQKQILVPELCFIHPFPASFWRKAVCLPCMLYRLNSLLVADELRLQIAREAAIGLVDLPPQKQWPALDFGWSPIVKQAAAAEAQREAGQPVTRVEPDYTRKNPGYNNAGRPDQEYIMPAKASGTVQVDSFKVDKYKADPLECLVNYDKKTQQSSESPSQPNQAPASDDPFSSMGDWSSFADKISVEQPDLVLTPQLPHIEIISGPFSALSSGAPVIDSSSLKFENDETGLSKMVQKKTVPTKKDESSTIVEIDEHGKPVAQQTQFRIGSPTQFDDLDDEDDGAKKRSPNAHGGFYAGTEDESGEEDIMAWNTEMDWTKVDEDDDNASLYSAPDLSKYTVDLQQLNKDIQAGVMGGDEDFLREIEQSYEEPAEDATAAKEIQDEIDDGSYSDFDVEDMDDEDELLFGEEIDDDDDEDDDLDDELDDDDDDDEDDDDFPSAKKRPKRLTAGKKAGKGRRLKKASESKDGGGGGGDEVVAGHYKTTIYDVLKYELLYDCRIFEKVSRMPPRLYGLDGAQLLMLDRKNRFKSKRIYDRIYQQERDQIGKCIEKVRIEIGEDADEDDEYFVDAPDDEIVCVQGEIDQRLDETLDDVELGKAVPVYDVVFNKFVDAELEIQLKSSLEPPEQPKEEEEEEAESEDPRTLMADYGLDVFTPENGHVKFGELLPNRQSDAAGDRRLASFSFDTNPGGGLCLGPDPSLILQAITMSNSSDGINLERLETVGDSFLKYSITAFLFCMCPDLNEGKLSFLRSRQISNINLHRLGQKIHLGRLMIASKFEPNDNWCPPGYKVIMDPAEASSAAADKNKDKVPYNLLTQHSIPNKSIADCVEALIGTYLISSGSQGAIQFMDWLGLKVLPPETRALTKIVDTVSAGSPGIKDQLWLPLPKSPLIVPKTYVSSLETAEATQQQPQQQQPPATIEEARAKLNEIYHKHQLDHFEQTLGYQFRDKAYLVQAFTHNSYYENTVTDCYQRLEFLGDAVLDYLITRYLYEDPRCHSPGTLTDLRSALVNNTFFASLAVKYNFHKYLMMLSFELYRVVDGFVRKFNICNQNRIYEQQQQAQQAQQEPSADSTSPQQQRSCVYWELFISENEAEHLEDIEVPKALGDIFESVAGAIYLDSGMSLDAVWRAYYPMMKPEIEYFSYDVPKSPIRVLLEKQPQSAKFGKPEITSGRKIRVCVEVFNVGKFVGVGRNKRIAKCTAAKRALRALKVLDDDREKQRQKIIDEEAAYQQELAQEFKKQVDVVFDGFQPVPDVEQQPPNIGPMISDMADGSFA